MRPTTYCLLIASSLALAGCASTPTETKPADGITYRKAENFEKVWVADGFDFSGYDGLIVEEIGAEGIKPKDEKERERLTMIQRSLARDLYNTIEFSHIVPKVATKEAELDTNSKALKLENTIIEFSRGSSALRYGVGFGAGMPRLRVRGRLTDYVSGKPLMIYEIDETGDWAATGFASARTIQGQAGAELADDIVEFMSQIAKHKPIKYR